MASTDPPETQHRIKVRILLVLASIFAFLAIFTSWVDRQALDTNEWVEHERQAAGGQGDLGRGRDLRRRRALRERRRHGGGQAAAARRPSAVLGPGRRRAFGSSPRRRLSRRSSRRGYSRPGSDANRIAHRQLVSILKGDNEVVSSQNGKVVLDLRPLVLQLADRIGLKKQLNDRAAAGRRAARGRRLEGSRHRTDGREDHRGARLAVHLRQPGALRARGLPGEGAPLDGRARLRPRPDRRRTGRDRRCGAR